MPSRLLFQVLFTLSLVIPAQAADWARFRGPNGSGVADGAKIPDSFGPDENVVWKMPFPPGHSSPVLFGKHIYATAFEDGKLLTICLDRATGRTIWRREAPRPRVEKVDKRNSPASPSPAVDSTGVYVFFADFGLLAYTLDGKPRWQAPLDPFNNIYGMGASPVIAGDMLVLICDQSVGSFAVGVAKPSGRIRWRKERPDALSGHSTPAVVGKLVIAPASFRVDAYDAKSGEIVWFARGLPSEMKSLPVVEGDTVYISGFSSPDNDPGKQMKLPAYDELIAKVDRNGDGQMSAEESPDEKIKMYFPFADLTADGRVNREEWGKFQAMMSAENALIAFRMGAQGDITASGMKWKYQRAVPQLPSVVSYRGVLYMVNDNGILTTLDPATGKVLKTARVRGISDNYYASPVAADGKVILVSLAGRITVLKAGGEQDVLSKSDLDEQVYGTPAIANGRIYLRSTTALWCFGLRN